MFILSAQILKAFLTQFLFILIYQPQCAAKLAVSLGHQTPGSGGSYLYSDFHDTNPDAFDAMAHPTGKGNAILHELRTGTIDNTSSDEAFNGKIKTATNRVRGKIVAQMKGLCGFLKTKSAEEHMLFGVSYVPPIFPVNDRIRGCREAEEMRIGMCFLGRCDRKAFMDQRRILSIKGEGATVQVFMLSRKENLFKLHVELENAKKESDDVNFDYSNKKYKRILFIFNRFQKIHTASRDELTILLQEKAQEMRDNENPADKALQNERAKAKSKFCALDNLILESDYFVVLTPILGNFKNIAREPFRATYKTDMRKAIYRWRCTCRHGLKKGFCSHIFFMQHSKHTSRTKLGPEFEMTDIPVRADIEDLSRKRRRGRPKKAAPALQRMDADIAAGVVLGAITDV